jgi:hypothetical protein
VCFPTGQERANQEKLLTLLNQQMMIFMFL